jgi:hypothetical protein
MTRLTHCMLLLCALLASPAWAAEPCPPTDQDLEWSPQCFESINGERRVMHQYLRKLRVNRAGVATMRIDGTFEMLAVDRRGKVLVPHIYFSGDFDYPSAPGNVGRFGRTQCGYFDTTTFKILVPPQYDFCAPFHKAQGQVCIGCQLYCSDDDCHDAKLIGGTSYMVNRRNQRTTGTALPTLQTACNGAPPLKLDLKRHLLTCPPGARHQTP